MKKKIDQKNSPSFLERIARSRSKEHIERKKQLEESPYHPSEELLRQYVLAELDKSDTEIVMEHVSLCRTCSRKVLRICWDSELTESLIDRIRDFVSSLSFTVFVQFPALELRRSAAPDSEVHVHAPGEPILLTLEAPADGYITILYCCEETGEVRLVFPAPGEDPKVTAGQDIDPVTDEITGPAGKHCYKIFWTKDVLFDSAIAFENDEKRLEVINDFLDSLEDLQQEDWRVVTHEFQVGE